MSNKQIVNEVFWLRAISCLAVILIHAISQSLDYGKSNSLEMIRMFSMFGTPAFIFISEFLIAKSYSENIPKNFLVKRMKILLIPFVLMGIIYAIFDNGITPKALAVGIIRNVLLFDYVAYFIIVIFQFYILHILLHKRLNRWDPKIALSISLLINTLYLSSFNFVEPFDFPYSRYIWYRVSWYPFFGWIFYFTLGYYCGKYYPKFITLLQKYKNLVFLYFVVSASIFITLWFYDISPSIVSSKRVDVLFFTISVIILIFCITYNFKKVPRFIMFISRYSFSIYLLHKLLMGFIPPIVDNIYLYTFILFSFSLISSIFISFLLNKTTFGKYIVGRIVSPPKPTEKKDIVA